MFGRALAFIGDDAGDGGGDSGVSGQAAGFFADVDDFFLALFHAGLGRNCSADLDALPKRKR